MPKSSVLVTLFSFNEGEKLRRLVSMLPADRSYDILIIDDGSGDGSREYLQAQNFALICHEENRGIGYGIREAITFARSQGYDIIVIMAANGKMQPNEIDNLLTPLRSDRFDYVQGSRNLPGGSSPHLPLFRKMMIRILTGVINLMTGFKGTDITCGFRAYRLNLFNDPRFRLDQAWLDRYEMEYYIHYHVLKGGYRVTEVPVSMVYPESRRNYSKIKPFTGWWSMLRPWLFLFLRIKR